VLVVGAGLGGLTAARTLAGSGATVVVLEARDRVGGRTLDQHLADGSTVELGGQWVGPTQDHILALLDELGLATHPTHDDGADLALLGPGRGPKRFTGKTFGLPPHALADVGLAQYRLERMAAEVPLEAPWNAPKAARWDAQTVETWLRRNVRTRMGRDVWRLIVGAVFACETDELSLLHLLFYCHAGGMVERLLSTAGGAQQDRVVGGTQRISERIAANLDVRLRDPVRAITQSDRGVVVATEVQRFAAERVIVAVPPTLTSRITYDPPLPGDRTQLIQNVPMGSVLKTMTVYERPWWRDDALSGQAVLLDAPVSVVFDNSPADSHLGVLLAFAEGRHAHDLRARSAGDRRRTVEDTLVRCFGPRARTSTDYVERDWATEEWSAGGYGGRMPTGVWTRLGGALRRPHGAIHWAGSETAEVWNGYMDGAVSSGVRAAKEVEAALQQGRDHRQRGRR
jgi:monoamine oxidase